MGRLERLLVWKILLLTVEDFIGLSTVGDFVVGGGRFCWRWAILLAVDDFVGGGRFCWRWVILLAVGDFVGGG